MSIDLDAIEAREKAASDHIADLCDARKIWTMHIPADPERDSDLILSRSLQDVSDLVSEVRRLRGQLDALDVIAEPDHRRAEHMRRTLRLAEGGDEHG